jgi:hypothetical protein
MDDISDDELFLDAADKVVLEASAAIGDDPDPAPGFPFLGRRRRPLLAELQHRPMPAF